jgi:hypothetical protein
MATARAKVSKEEPKIAFFDQARFKYANIVGDRIAREVLIWRAKTTKCLTLKLTNGDFDLIFCKNLRSAPEAEEKGEARKIRREQTRRRNSNTERKEGDRRRGSRGTIGRG